MLSVTKRFHFCYGHFLPDYDGPCQAVHGHNSILEVEVFGGGAARQIANSAYPGMVVDFSELATLVKKHVIDKLDHSFLNDNPFLDDATRRHPTAERIVIWIVSVLGEHLDNLQRVRLYETPDSYAEWRVNP